MEQGRLLAPPAHIGRSCQQHPLTYHQENWSPGKRTAWKFHGFESNFQLTFSNERGACTGQHLWTSCIRIQEVQNQRSEWFVDVIHKVTGCPYRPTLHRERCKSTPICCNFLPFASSISSNPWFSNGNSLLRSVPPGPKIKVHVQYYLTYLDLSWASVMNFSYLPCCPFRPTGRGGGGHCCCG